MANYDWVIQLPTTDDIAFPLSNRKNCFWENLEIIRKSRKHSMPSPCMHKVLANQTTLNKTDEAHGSRTCQRDSPSSWALYSTHRGCNMIRSCADEQVLCIQIDPTLTFDFTESFTLCYESLVLQGSRSSNPSAALLPVRSVSWT